MKTDCCPTPRTDVATQECPHCGPNATPRTDAELKRIEDDESGYPERYDTYIAMVAFARELERELAATNIKIQSVLDERKEVVERIVAENSTLRMQCASLRDWKESAMSLEMSWDEQAIGKILNLPLGTFIRPQILPAIQALRTRLERAESLIRELTDDRAGTDHPPNKIEVWFEGDNFKGSGRTLTALWIKDARETVAQITK